MREIYSLGGYIAIAKDFMQRRTFILSTGGFLLANSLGACAPRQSHTGPALMASRRRFLPSDFPTPILKAACLGMNAPNPHNTQAWKFRIQSDTSMALHIDESRLLPLTDPPARQIHIGAGCFLELLSLSAPSLGFRSTVEALPQGEYPLEKTGAVALASVELKPGPREEHPLLSRIYTRHTNRKAYRKGSPGRDGFETILKQTGTESLSVEMIDEPARLAKVLDICFKGMEIESRLRRTNEESRIWFRGSDEAMAEKRDGTSLEGNGLTGMRKFFAERYLKGGNPERWHSSSSLDSYLKSYRKTLNSTSAVVLFKTRSNTMRDWLAAGKDYVRFQLAADLNGWCLHPMSQVLQEFPEMQEMADGLNRLAGVQSPEKIQMLVRIGRADTGFQSYRRNPSEMIL
jgi:hypothetical protein